MVEVIHRAKEVGDHGYPGMSPLIHIHSVRRDEHGNGIDITIKGEMRIAAGEYVYAKNLKLNTIQTMNLTPELPANDTLGYIPQKFINHKGEYDNWASIDIYDHNGVWQGPAIGPSEGSVWLDFTALGE